MVSGGTPAWDAMTARTGGRTTPQILINDEVIGGYDELAVLNAQGILDDKLGLDSGAARALLYDVIIIGSGPAGMTAAIYSARKGLKTLVLAKDVGGQLNISAELENYLGYASIDAPTLITHFEDHVERFDVTRVVGEEVVNLDVTEKIKMVATQAGNRYQGRTVIIASGKYPRPLGVVGEQRLLGKGVAYCATCDAPFYKDKVVAVVGGGNAALEAAAELQRWATHVYLIVRSTTTADDILVDRVTRMAQVEVLLGYETLEILGEQHVSGVRVG
jgi:NADH-dependent peroxiredoxin subunit F